MQDNSTSLLERTAWDIVMDARQRRELCCWLQAGILIILDQMHQDVPARPIPMVFLLLPMLQTVLPAPEQDQGTLLVWP